MVRERLAPARGPWQIIDVGAGLGANVRHIAPTLDGPQRWWLLDNDPALLARAPGALTAWASEAGWDAEPSADGVILTRDQPPGELQVTMARGSLMTLAQHAPLETTGLVTANAVFDLLSEAQFADFVAQLRPSRTALWATLNVTGMALSDADEPAPEGASPDESDRWVVERYSAHMRRPRAGGDRAMGDHCELTMTRTLRAAGYQVAVRPSPWHIGPEASDTAMMTFMLNFIAGAVPQVCAAEERPRFERWLERRRRDAARHKLKLRVDHVDILAWCP